MTALTDKITNIFHSSEPAPTLKTTPPDDSAPKDAKLTKKPGRPKMLKPNKYIGITSACRSKTASSCELFGMLKALAAGGNDLETNSGTLDSDEDEDGGLVFSTSQPGRNPPSPTSTSTPKPRGESRTTRSPTKSSTTTPRAESSTTIRAQQGEDHVDGDRGKQEALQRWMDETVGRTLSQSELLSSRFAGKSHEKRA